MYEYYLHTKIADRKTLELVVDIMLDHGVHWSEIAKSLTRRTATDADLLSQVIFEKLKARLAFVDSPGSLDFTDNEKNV